MQSYGKVVKIHTQDNIAVALHDLLPGEQIDTGSGVALSVKEQIPAGHKIAWKDIRSGEDVIKYSYPIGHAVEDIPQGTWVHTHNVKTNLSGLQEYKYTPDPAIAPNPSPNADSTLDSENNTGCATPKRMPYFHGYERNDARLASATRFGSFQQSAASTRRQRGLHSWLIKHTAAKGLTVYSPSVIPMAAHRSAMI
jgi:hypothetical protein